MQITKLLLLSLLLVSACARKPKPPQPGIPFEKTKWSMVEKGEYTYRQQMVKDLVNNHKWTMVTKDSLLQMLGQPDDIENEINYLYYYEKEPMLGGIMFSHKAITFELLPGAGKVKQVSYSKGAEWGN
jgi:hypothetical protein